MADPHDPVAHYANSRGMSIRHRTVLVEGDTDVRLLHLAARLETAEAEPPLIGQDLAVVSPGYGDAGGCSGVIRELVTLRNLAKTFLFQSGRPRYRFIGLFDNDKAGRAAVSLARQVDTSILEYKDLFLLHPVMPVKGSLDPKTLRTSFERGNAAFKGLEWELEDLLPSAFLDAFDTDFPNALRRQTQIGANKIHRDYSAEGKSQLHRFVQENALREDLTTVIGLLSALRFYCGLN